MLSIINTVNWNGTNVKTNKQIMFRKCSSLWILFEDAMIFIEL